MNPTLEYAYQPRHAYEPRHALARREPGKALAADPAAPLLMRGTREPTPPPDELVESVLDALRRCA